MNQLEQVATFKYLGMVLDCKLTFAPHIEALIEKSNKHINCLWRVRKYITSNIALLLFKSLVVPHFDFGDIVYMHCTQDLQMRLQYIQNNACRMILKADRYSSVLGMHQQLGLSTLTERRMFHACGFMFKVQKGLISANNVCTIFEVLELVHDRETRARNRGDLQIVQSRTQMGEKSIQIFGSRIWNLMPVCLRNLNTIETFCKHYWNYQNNGNNPP